MSDSGLYMGVEIGATKLQVLVASADGRVVNLRRAKVQLDRGAGGIRASIIEEIKALCAELRPAAVGVGFGGPVDWRTGVVVQSFQVDGWAGCPLAEWLRDELGGVPVFVENDAKAAAYAEAMFGAGRGHRLVFYSNSGSGVGAGLVIDGELYRGEPPGELELGHVRLDPSGRTVEDGASGWHLDKLVREESRARPSGRLAALVASAQTTGGEAQLLGAALADQDSAAEAILTRTARDYAHGLSHAVHLLHPGIIILGGGVSLLGEAWRAAVAEHLSEFLMDAFRPGPPIALAELGEIVVPLGAAMLAKRRAQSAARPHVPGSKLESWINEYFDAQRRVLGGMKAGDITPIIALLQEANAANRQIFVCGNGGNAANSSHFATDLGKNASAAVARPFRVLSLNDNVSWLTAIGNDYQYEDIFVRQIANYAQAGDVLIASTVSGNSRNIVRVLEWSRERGLKTVALVGARQGHAAELADHVIVIDDTHYGRVEDAQMQILHILCYAFVEKTVAL